MEDIGRAAVVAAGKGERGFGVLKKAAADLTFPADIGIDGKTRPFFAGGGGGEADAVGGSTVGGNTTPYIHAGAFVKKYDHPWLDDQAYPGEYRNVGSNMVRAVGFGPGGVGVDTSAHSSLGAGESRIHT